MRSDPPPLSADIAAVAAAAVCVLRVRLQYLILDSWYWYTVESQTGSVEMYPQSFETGEKAQLAFHVTALIL